eukprot:scaffold72454_cov31-Tisochrysis_lutea.AAC.2
MSSRLPYCRLPAYSRNASTPPREWSASGNASCGGSLRHPSRIVSASCGREDVVLSSCRDGEYPGASIPSRRSDDRGAREALAR